MLPAVLVRQRFSWRASRAEVIAVAGAGKAKTLIALGATTVIDRNADLVASLGSDSIDVVVDLVGGGNWPQLLDLLRRGGRYVTSGAIAGPIVDLDLRTLYLKDLSLFGGTWQDVEVFKNLISYIERNEVSPLIAKTFPLHEIGKAQELFLEKSFIGKIVLTVPPVSSG